MSDAGGEKNNSLFARMNSSTGLREFAYCAALVTAAFFAKEATNLHKQPAPESTAVEQNSVASEQFRAARQELIARNALALAANAQRTRALTHETILLAQETTALRINTVCQSDPQTPLEPGFKAVCDGRLSPK